MYMILLGALLEIAGMVYLVLHVTRGGTGSAPAASQTTDTLEPPQSGEVFTLRGHWPGVAMIAIGALVLLIGGRH